MIDNIVTVDITRSDGETYRIGGDSGWRIPNDGLTNLANLPHSLTTVEIPHHSGGLIEDKRIGIADRTIIAKVEKPSDCASLRASAISFFNPEYTFEMKVRYLGRVRKCSGEQAGFMVSSENVYDQATLTWTLMCADPYWRDGEVIDTSMTRTVGKLGFPWVSLKQTYDVVTEGRLGFPWVCPMPGQGGGLAPRAVFGTTRKKGMQDLHGRREGAIFGYIEKLDKVPVISKGDVSSGLKIKMYATGEVQYPTVRVGYSYVRLNTTLIKGDTVTIDTTQLPPLIAINGNNAMHKVDRRSDILGLVADSKAANLSYDAEAGQENLTVSFSYENRYLGL